jgi:hypothetical protein
VAKWANLYGPPLFSNDQKQADLMALYGEQMGSHYRGRILYTCEAHYNKDEKQGTVNLENIYEFPNNPTPNV